MDRYHHGALREALIEATEALLAERGPEAFSLREVARRAGVSPAAPAHHFGDAGGLLTAVATLGFDGLARALEDAQARAGVDARARLRAQGMGYVGFAMRYPGRFRLMFRGGMLRDDPELARAGGAAFAVLEDGVREAFGIARGRPLPGAASTTVLTLWSTVHGYAHLAIAGRFDAFGAGAGREAFVARSLGPVLDTVIAGCLGEAGAPARRKAPGAARRKSR